MDIRERPDKHVLSRANEFLETAKSLDPNESRVIAPTARRVNAAFSIELFLKSLLSTWHHGAGAEVVTLTSRGHDLQKLWNEVDTHSQEVLCTAFANSSLSNRYESIQVALARFSIFTTERYDFETGSDYDRPATEDLMDFANSVGNAINSMTPIRF